VWNVRSVFNYFYAFTIIISLLALVLVMQKNIVEALVKEFADPVVGAVQGRVVVLNEPQNMVTRLVALERIGGYRVDQEARDNLSLIPQFGGTCH
jgi:cellulose synthase/poly-beta-1,6-N-acetylglucosamine synthase-like glycosyltransferase